jgi:hypothetical protein
VSSINCRLITELTESCEANRGKAIAPKRPVISAGTTPALAFTCMYIVGAVTALNRIADGSAGSYHSSTLLPKHVSRGKSASSTFTLRPWGPFSDVRRVRYRKRAGRVAEAGARLSGKRVTAEVEAFRDFLHRIRAFGNFVFELD